MTSQPSQCARGRCSCVDQAWVDAVAASRDAALRDRARLEGGIAQLLKAVDEVYGHVIHERRTEALLAMEAVLDAR
jgi:hypothetical protein